MMNEHVSPEEIRRFRAGALPAGESRRVGNHVALCGDCSLLAQIDPAARQTADALAQALTAHDDHPGIDTISAFAEGRLTGEQRSFFEEHIEECARCREDVEDIQSIAPMRPARRRRRRQAFLLATAAIAAAMVILFLISMPGRERPAQRTEVPSPRVPKTSPESRWAPEVRSAVATGQLDPPSHLLELRQPLDALRGEDSAAPSIVQLTVPVDEIVESTRPAFRWEPLDGARYVVVIAEHGRSAIRSPELRIPEWKPDQDLVRGHDYEWQLEVIRKGRTVMVPEPPEPPVRFGVITIDEASELETARRKSPDDHLLLGVLAAHAGLRREAEVELRHAEENPSSAGPAHRLLESLSRWPRRSVVNRPRPSI